MLPKQYMIEVGIYLYFVYIQVYCISGVMVSMLTSSALDYGFESRSGQTKDYKISYCCISAKHTAIRRKSKNWLAQKHDNVFEWSDYR